MPARVKARHDSLDAKQMATGVKIKRRIRMHAASSAMPLDPALDNECINTLRFLSVDAVQKADSGHPGLPMGAAAMAYVLWTRFLKHNPANPEWFDRDRFVLSPGHGSMLLYSLLHLTGYDLPLEQIKRFREWGSMTPGHPERGMTPGVETTTGPLGQGFGNGVGLAMAEAHLAACYNLQMAGEGRGLRGYALHQIAIADDPIGEMIDDLGAGPFQQAMHGKLPDGWDRDIPAFPPDTKGMATRVAAGKVMNAVAPRLPALIGGSADLNPSTHTALSGLGDFEPAGVTVLDKQGAVDGVWSYAGRNLHFGVREHGMGAILNGLAAHGGAVPFGATFLIFSDYMRPPIRLAAMMKLHVIYVFTHDSIALGQDGSTHQPVEQLAGLRAVPGLTVIRPGDANEAAVAWRVALEAGDHPVALILTRQNVSTLDRTQCAAADGLRQGAYVLADAPNGKPDVILIASGSEVELVMAARQILQERNIGARVVSMPSWDLFDAQPRSYRDQVLLPSIHARLAVEAGASQGWHRYVGDGGDVLGVDRFGASAPGDVVMREYGFTAENVCKRALAVLG
jgi:transketolase